MGEGCDPPPPPPPALSGPGAVAVGTGVVSLGTIAPVCLPRAEGAVKPDGLDPFPGSLPLPLLPFAKDLSLFDRINTERLRVEVFARSSQPSSQSSAHQQVRSVGPGMIQAVAMAVATVAVQVAGTGLRSAFATIHGLTGSKTGSTTGSTMVVAAGEETTEVPWSLFPMGPTSPFASSPARKQRHQGKKH